MDDRFKPVPLKPLLPVGEFKPFDWWLDESGLKNRIYRALRGGAIVSKRCGPRGGKWYGVASAEAWRVWARAFNKRARSQWQGRRAAEVARALGSSLSPRAKRLRERTAVMRRGRV